MDASTETITAWSLGLAGGAYAALAIYLAAGWRAGLRSRALFLAVILCAVWGMAGLVFVLTGQSVFLAGSLLADILRFGGWTLFLLVLLKPEAQALPQLPQLLPQLLPTRLRWLAGLAMAILSVGIAAQLMLWLGVDFIMSSLRLALFDALAMTVLALVLVEQLFRNASPDARWSIKPLCIGLGGAFLFDLYLYSDALLFNRIDADALSIRGFVHALVVPLVALSTIRSRGWKKKVVLSQRAALQSATLFAVGVYLLFMAAAGYYVRYFGGEWGRAVQLALLFSALLLLGMLGLSGSMRAKLRVQIGKHFFNYRYDYREEWLRFTNTLSSQNGFSEMGRDVAHGLADMVESPAGGLWLKDPSGRFFAQAAGWNMPVSSATEEAGSPLCSFLVDSGWIINLEEFRTRPQLYEPLTLPDWLSTVPNAWLIVPLATGNEMIGYVVLATARTRVEVNWEVNDLLKTAGRQAGAFLGQMQATEALLEAQKFGAFNRMSAFVVHDLKNVVTQLSLMLKNAERHRDKPEFQRDMLMTVENSVERMRQLMMQLREGATPVESPRGVELGDVIRRIQSLKAGQGRAVEVTLSEEIIARGHEARIERVISHLVQNALDATETNEATDRGSRVRVSLSRQGRHAQIIVSDNGQGMTPEFLRERLFKPFQTTKPAGMGIGAYESFQYVNELGGSVSVASEINLGTEVRLLLPVFDTGAGAAADPGFLQQAAA